MVKYVYEFTNQRKLTKAEFLRWFQKKVLYTIRKFKMIQNNDIVFYENKGSFKDVVLGDALKMFAEKGNVELIKNKSKKFNKKAIPSTTDTEADKFIYNLIKGNTKSIQKLHPVYERTIKPLYLFLDKEVLLYAKLKNLKYRQVNERKDKIVGFLDKLEDKHPEVKQAIIKSYVKIVDI